MTNNSNLQSTSMYDLYSVPMSVIVQQSADGIFGVAGRDPER